MRRWLLWTPLVVFLGLFGLVAIGLIAPADRTVRSQLVGKPIPVASLPPIISDRPGFSRAPGAPRLVNVFASWCVPCATEVGQLAALSARGVAVDGIAVRDTPRDLAAFFARHGNPYRSIGDDPASATMISLGSSGVPESFVVDARGIIRYQHVGAIGPQDFAAIMRAMDAAR